MKGMDFGTRACHLARKEVVFVRRFCQGKNAAMFSNRARTKGRRRICIRDAPCLIDVDPQGPTSVDCPQVFVPGALKPPYALMKVTLLIGIDVPAL